MPRTIFVMQDIASILALVVAILYSRVVQVLEPYTGSAGYHSFTIIFVRDSIIFQTRRLFFITSLSPRGGTVCPYPSLIYAIFAFLYPIGSG